MSYARRLVDIVGVTHALSNVVSEYGALSSRHLAQHLRTSHIFNSGYPSVDPPSLAQTEVVLPVQSKIVAVEMSCTEPGKKKLQAKLIRRNAVSSKQPT